MIDNHKLPLIALRNIVVFPGIVAPIFIGREKSLNSLLAAQDIEDGQHILLVTQKKLTQDDPHEKDLYKIGVLAKVIQTLQLPNNNAKILVEAISRVKLTNIDKKEFFTANFEVLSDDEIIDIDTLTDRLDYAIKSFKEYIQTNKKANPDILTAISEQKDPGFITNILASHLSVKLSIKQKLLEEVNVISRLKILIKVIDSEITSAGTEQVIHQRVKKQIEKTQRDYYLQEQMKAIQKELDGDDKSDFFDFEKKIKTLKLSNEAKEKAIAELKKLRQMNPMSAESSVIRNYLETLLGLPWKVFDKDHIDIKKTAEILNRDHFGLEKVKDRIVEYIAVLQRSNKLKSPILCFIGPPGVGKTSLVKSIAEALGKKYCKFSLGGVKDEAEIRGHRKTYLGSMPGKILTLIKKSKVSNPVILLDEIDKMSSDYRGDPSSALLEVLDPEQNMHFVDHYLEVEYDLSKVMFIATANTYDLPRPLIDRLEIINISGYIEEEKLQIAKNYLVPKQFKAHGIDADEITLSDEVLLHIIRYYTKESGVRSLEREIGALCRKALKKLLENKELKRINFKIDDLEEYLGVTKYRFGIAELEDQIGAVTGLAYTEAGGDLLTIEAVSFPGKGEVKTTGKLGDVMKESAQAAYSCFRVRAKDFGLNYEDYKELDIHLHVPEGAIPKDGPSAGIAMFTTIMSLMTQIPVKKTVAMTGEITLLGKVLPIGGLKEKLLAAMRGGIKTVLIPEQNVKDLKDIPLNIKNSIQIIPVSTVDQVLEQALVKPVNQKEPNQIDLLEDIAVDAIKLSRCDDRPVDQL